MEEHVLRFTSRFLGREAEYALFLPRFDEAYQLAQEKPLALVALVLYFGIKSLNVFQKHLGDVGDILARYEVDAQHCLKLVGGTLHGTVHLQGALDIKAV